MDRHDIAGVDPESLAAAHQEDLKVMGRYGVRFLTYWFDEPRGAAFCLIEAPNKEAVHDMHQEAHGFVPNEILEVDQGLVEAFLGRVTDPGNAHETPISDSAFRTIMFTDMKDSTGLTSRLGDEGAMQLLRVHNGIIRGALQKHQGREVKQTGDGFMASFVSVARGVECAIDVQRDFATHNAEHPSHHIEVRIGLTAGEPVRDGGDLFGACVQLAARLCSSANPGQILVAHVVQELCLGKQLPFRESRDLVVQGFPDPIQTHEVSWAEA